MNYVTVDAYRIGEFPFWFHQTWTTSLQLCLSLIILFRAVGLATFAALAIIVLTVLCNAPLAKLQHRFQTRLMTAQDERLKACGESLVNMKVLKLYAWETHFKNVIEKLREVEYTWLRAVQLRKSYNSVLFWSSPVLVSTATFGACYFLKVPLHANNVFTFVATLRLVQEPVRSIPDVIGVVIQAKVAFSRIVRFLEAPELENVQVHGSIAYVSQTAWIQTGSIQCSLVKDLELLPYGDLTEIGERGVNLSGGQKQRIQLARALYQDADVYLLDDPFSAVDAHTATSLFNEYVMEALSTKTVFLVTHQVDFLPTFDAVLVDNPKTSKLKLIAVYLLIGAGSVFFLLTRAMATVVLNMQSSRSLFSQLLNSLFRAPMSFYDSTPLGRILSRVSADLSIVDLDLPFCFIFAVGATSNAYASLGVLAVITWQVLFVSIPMVYLAIRLQKYYFSSAKEFMRMNGTTKSYVANHLAESVAGAVTIRAFRQEDRFFAKSLHLIDTNASPFFHSFTANEWLIQRLETMCAVVLASAALCMVLLPPGSFSSVSIQNQCTLANYIISVERLNQYMHIPSEAPEVIEDNRPSPNWPSVGKVEICDLKIRYRHDTPLVLRGISCTFQGGHKIGIVGRTGSGKTTLIGALFRLVEPTGGKIVVDGIDISKIGLHDLRSRFGIIPQDPTLFNGTVRYNLDPLAQHTDQEIWEVLGKCQLREVVQDKEVGLDSLVMEDGSNWSMGQRQLFCLGRALLRRSRVLVLDEATASIDNATDSILQKTIRTEFADCTVITVAHRIPTVMDCTMVLAIKDGKLVEYDEPMKLMKTEGSLFGQLVKEYWSHSESSQ
ncbi:ABC transporter C family member 10 [Linum perenne]